MADSDLSREVRQKIQDAIGDSEDMDEKEYQQQIELQPPVSGQMRTVIFRETQNSFDETIEIYLKNSFKSAKQSQEYSVEDLFVRPLSVVLYELRQHSLSEFQDFANKFGNHGI